MISTIATLPLDGNALDRDLGTWHGTGAFGDGLRHLLDVAIGAVIEDENLGHRSIARFVFRAKWSASAAATVSCITAGILGALRAVLQARFSREHQAARLA